MTTMADYLGHSTRTSTDDAENNFLIYFVLLNDFDE